MRKPVSFPQPWVTALKPSQLLYLPRPLANTEIVGSILACAETLRLLCDAVMEDVRLYEASDLLGPGTHALPTRPSPSLCRRSTWKQTRRRSKRRWCARAVTRDAAAFGAAAARACSGIAMWPSLELDDHATLEARGPGGVHMESSWPAVLPLLGQDPLPVAPGDGLTVALWTELANGGNATSISHGGHKQRSPG